MWPRSLLFALAVLLVGCSSGPTADLVLTNGTVATLDGAHGDVEALAAAGDTVLAVGSAEDIEAHVGTDTRVIDLDGRLAVPGFIEGHGHYMGMGEAQMQLGLLGTPSWERIVAMVDSAATASTDGAWVQGRGWHQEKWDATPDRMVRGFQTNERLNQVAPETPVYLTHASGHAAIANDAALEAAGIGPDTPDPDGGTVVRDAQGRATGVLLETAAGLVQEAVEASRSNMSPQQRRRRRERQVRLAAEEALANGVTSFQDQGASFETIELYRTMAENEALGIRMYAMVSQGEVATDTQERLAEIRAVGAADHHLTVRSIGEVTADGALGSRSAWMLEPYDDAPDDTGINVTSMDRIREIAEIALEEDYQLAVHAIGDRANRETLDLYASLFEEAEGSGAERRWRIEHAQHLHPDDIPRFGDLGVIASMQAIHACSDAPYNYERLGAQRVNQGAYLWKTLREDGVVVGNGTDVPVEKINPLASLHCTVARQVPGSDTTFTAEEALTPREALKSYTINNARMAFEEDIKGTLTPGKLSDVAVLSHNILTGPPERLREATVDYTVVGGEVVYTKE
ncbi:amidohydrolase [Salinibacter altiplanensis]|uniref:amidohydrolase n=1 Tax=Salinibacter altiplanensis TaxID=1803181 RepID=UPI000C9F2FD9|nr:amidohydrolase [Salinibacter altiplanensis]